MSRTMIIEESKDAFIEALFQLLANESFEHITVKQLTLESGYSKRTYYRYFKTKTKILDIAFCKYLSNYHDYLLGSSITPDTIPKHLLEFIWPHRDKIELLARNDLLVPLLTRHIQTIVALLLSVNVPWRKNGSNDQHYEYMLTYSIGGFGVLLDTLFKKSTPLSPGQISKALSRALNEIAIQVNIE
ncbi:TetR/AcrR family transcriptional regulator [Lactiplantibacillus plantarum]|uniref:TetR/AcrR family transcriptional regulator n=2 Tax=Lactiplantibacillus plantarum TaxID=1590 RepID=UPI0005FAA88D|nr:TetR family transcriptional regulator [Lactiplantibacillus plantarum]MBO2728887.1 TetR family transcriptional regulator [Lactiplantibacillus plantarum]MCG0571722.1 TetR family transcriptional regulator [Lactiplantibacillus plantarum]MCG0673557.1 TetR family transcriptional regulator [Lactiplantibacillus plantarum]MCG0782213.1 TetR family transcriptional regulator [Lactiplantibacillus plantarum]MCG0862215.1 TetR family transcriptional regulator [Lactiplantibacillus plantarum]